MKQVFSMKTILNLLSATLIGGLLQSANLYAQAGGALSKQEKENILESFVQDFSKDPYAREMTFGFKVDEDKWHMVVSKESTGGLSAVLNAGFPSTPILYWEMDSQTLAWLDDGLNGETATSRARGDDPYPLKTRATKGFPTYTVNKELNNFLEELRLHFWTRGIPEKFKLSKDVARLAHGGYVVGLVYGEGLRTVWYQIDPGQHMNEEPEDQINTFNSLFIVTKGTFNAKIDGEEMLFEEGNSYLIPADISHEFWNSFDSPGQFVLIMYGEGA